MLARIVRTTSASMFLLEFLIIIAHTILTKKSFRLNIRIYKNRVRVIFSPKGDFYPPYKLLPTNL